MYSALPSNQLYLREKPVRSMFQCFIVVLVLSLVCSEPLTYYDVLGVTKESTDQEIKTNFRRRSIKFHPDKLEDATDAEKAEAALIFDRLAVAQDVLTDKTKRWRYEKMMGFGVYDYDEIAWGKIQSRMEDEWADKGNFKPSWMDQEYIEYNSYWEGVALAAGGIGLIAVMLPIFWYSGDKKQAKTAEQKKAERARMVAAEKAKLQKLSQKKNAGFNQKDVSQRKKGEPRKKKVEE
eukprot:CAMPEP_0175148944 /NCGR_PEP_ID=MMETSP0087-20121206/16928_1 /TAXON_ID=136419 /ORGANISM="Unknown Unknown, Strain D1" /LENGTH=235 /DNA_ID=CAMNT_0016434499 /DNA_START=102 /DNA_END=809 /DNA_ORIENTATION=-